MSRLLRYVAIPGVLAFLVAACGREEPAPVDKAQPVRVVKAAPARAPAGLVATGQVRAHDELPLAFKAPGIVREVLVDPGQRVRRDQVLATLDAAEIDAQYALARENLTKAERDLARVTALREKGMVSEQGVQDAQTQRDVLRAALDAAASNRAYATIVAPGDGVILERRAVARETVAAGQPVFVFGQLDRGWLVRAGLPAREYGAVVVGNAVAVKIDGAPEPLAGKVLRVAAASDPRTGTVDVDVTLPPTKVPLVSGMVARLDFAAATAKPDKSSSPGVAALALPMSAILEGSAGTAKVFVLDASRSKVKRVEVRVGRLLEGAIEVLDGLPEGAEVVSEGAAWLSDGEAVRVLP